MLLQSEDAHLLTLAADKCDDYFQHCHGTDSRHDILPPRRYDQCHLASLSRRKEDPIISPEGSKHLPSWFVRRSSSLSRTSSRNPRSRCGGPLLVMHLHSTFRFISALEPRCRNSDTAQTPDRSFARCSPLSSSVAHPVKICVFASRGVDDGEKEAMYSGLRCWMVVGGALVGASL